MNPNSARVLTRVAAVWLGVGAVMMGAIVARTLGFVLRLHGQRPAALFLVPAIFGSASILGVVGAVALWGGRRIGRAACVVSGTALLVGFGPAAVLRGQAVLLALLIVTLAAVLYVCSRPVGRFCAGHR